MVIVLIFGPSFFTFINSWGVHDVNGEEKMLDTHRRQDVLSPLSQTIWRSLSLSDELRDWDSCGFARNGAFN